MPLEPGSGDAVSTLPMGRGHCRAYHSPKCWVPAPWLKGALSPHFSLSVSALLILKFIFFFFFFCIKKLEINLTLN